VSTLAEELRKRVAHLKVCGVSGGGILIECADELEILTRQRDFWQKQRNALRAALIEALEATQDDDGKWVDRNGDYVDALNYVPTEAQEALKWEREADALRIGNGHLRDRIAAMEGKQ
jgi:hypothetical protein